MNGTDLLLDSNIILYFLNGDTTLADFLEDKQMFVSFITEMELLSFKGLSNEEEKHIQQFLSECKIININSEIKAEAIRIRRNFGKKLPDSIISATSIFMEIPLITADSDFKKIEGIELIYYKS
ncbi:MAG: type II toxin-antitoxin system VapC family toxin [Bergeyella sp.]